MANDPKPSGGFGWGAILGLFALFGLVGLSLTTIGSKANVNFSTVGNSLCGSGSSSYDSSLSRWSNSSPVIAFTPLPQADDLRPVAPAPPPPSPELPTDTANFQRVYENDFQTARDTPLSTFSVDVDTASYSLTRRFLKEGKLPPPDAVRVADFINYFTYDYPVPTGEHPVSITADIAGCPWKAGHRLVRIGLRGKRIAEEAMPPRNLVFLVDTSGSMNPPNRLPLVKAGLRMLIDRLTARDRVAIVVYAGSAGLCLKSTPGDQKDTIRQRSTGFMPAAAPTAAKASSWHTAWPARTSSPMASTASSWRPTAISTSARPARPTWSG